jgi:chromosomal replication initiation ATPase DnaA
VIDPMVWRLNAAHPQFRPQWLQERMLPAIKIAPTMRLHDVIKAIKEPKKEKSRRPKLPMVIVSLNTVAVEKKQNIPHCRTIAEHVIAYYRINENDFYSRRRNAQYVLARQVTYYLCKELTRCGLPSIGRFLDGRDHTTILHGIRKIQSRMGTDRQLAADIDFLRKQLVASEPQEAEAA